MSHHVLVAGSSVGNGGLKSVRFQDVFKIGVAHIGHSNVSLFTSPRLALRMNSHIVMMNRRSTMRHITDMLNGSLGHLSRPGVIAVFMNVFLNVLLNDLPVTFPNVPAPMGLNLTNNPLIITVLVNHFKCGLRLIACAAVDTGLVLHRVNVMLFLTDINVRTKTGFMRAIMRKSNLLCINCNFLVAIVPLLVVKTVTHLCCGIGCFALVKLVTNDGASPPTLTCSGRTSGGSTPTIKCSAICPLAVFLHVLTKRVVLLLVVWLFG